MGIVGIRREDKSEWERRVPLVPQDVRRLSSEGTRILVQSSPNRCFPDSEYRDAGAEVVDDLGSADFVLGVKEVPVDRIAADTGYLFFSHTMKGQSYNMPMLRKLLDNRCTLLDYELVTDDEGMRTIAFGRFAGLAGAIDTLWALGWRYASEGIDTPLAGLKQALESRDLEEAQGAVRQAGERIAAEGLPEEISPLVIAVTGEGGKVWGGAMELLELLPHRHVRPDELASAVAEAKGRAREVWLVSYGPGELVEPIDDSASYSWDDYLHHPERYRARFGRDLGHLSAIVHGIYWAEGYPRFILAADVARLWREQSTPKLRLITDITCDVGGSNECLLQTTSPGEPLYVYDPETAEMSWGIAGPGPVVLAVDILPAELPRDASRHFSAALVDLVGHFARENPFPAADDESIPGPLRRSLMALRGDLVPPWDERLAAPLHEHGGEPTEVR